MAKKKSDPRPFGLRYLIRRDPIITKTEGGLSLPENTASKRAQGTILSVGTGDYVGEHFMTPRLEVGSRVLFSDWAGVEVSVPEFETGQDQGSGASLVLVDEKDIQLVL